MGKGRGSPRPFFMGPRLLGSPQSCDCYLPFMESVSKKRVLVCPLDWGLGHATRCVPVIREFQSQGAEVLIAATGLQTSFFSQEVPEVQQIAAPSYNIHYPKHGWMMPFWLFREIPRLRKLIREEHTWAEHVCKEHNIDLVVSDNRFGCYATDVPSIYITHQIRIPFSTPFQPFEILGEKVHAFFQKPFQQVWIPDIPEASGLGGKMSHQGTLSGKHRYLGYLTRFETSEAPSNKVYDWLAMLSGPEPQRSLLESKIIAAFTKLPGKKLLIQGRPGCAEISHTIPDLQVYSHLKTEVLRTAIQSSEVVICRSGYSSLMDLQALGAKSILIPTPGQTEQEYLGRTLRKSKTAGFLLQSEISAKNLSNESKLATGFTPSRHGTHLLKDAIHSALALPKRNRL